jgi:hypothetical protein
LASALRDAGFSGPVAIERAPDDALTRAIDLSQSMARDVLVTGSLYLAGQLRRHWFPNDEIVVQRTPWPSVSEC